MNKQLSEKQKALLKEALELLKQAQRQLDNMNQLIDEIVQEEYD